MKLGIMQPYFFPYIGYFALIAHTDQWIIFDITQYTPKSWMNRNRVLHPTQGWNYITVPLANSSISIKTREAQVQDMYSASKSVLGKLSHYRKQAPYYQEVLKIVMETFAATQSNLLVDLNVNGITAVCHYLNIPFNYKICSQLNLPLPEKMLPGKWAPEICRLFGADAYLNPPGGRDLFDPQEFSKSGIQLEFLRTPEFIYKTGMYEFEPYLSILDVMMWNSPQTILDTIQKQFTPIH